MNPNLLIICTDQQRYDTIHCLNNNYIDTPNLDKLCKTGIAFENCYCQSPTCTPSRASFMTGKYPSATFSNYNGNEYFSGLSKLFTKSLSEKNYYIGLSGKLHLASGFNGIENRGDDGIDEFYYSHDPWVGDKKSNKYLAFLNNLGYTKNDVFNNKTDALTGNVRFYGYKGEFPKELRQTKWCSDKAINFFEEHTNENWGFICNIFDPHPPFDAPNDLINKYLKKNLPEPIFDKNVLDIQSHLCNEYMQDYKNITDTRLTYKRRKASYYASIELIDNEVGRMVNKLKETGQYENTIIVFTSDHGEMLGDHGMFLKGCRFAEGLVKVPLIISYPKKFKTDYIFKNPVELLDLTATFNELFELEMENLHGYSLLSILNKEGNPNDFKRDFIRTEYYSCLRHNEPHKTCANMIMKNKMKLCIYHGNNYGELYDLSIDPEERNNLWDLEKYQKIKFDLLKLCYDDNIRKNNLNGKTIGGY